MSVKPSPSSYRSGLDFYSLVRGMERSYSCTYLINLDADLLGLCADEDRNALDLARDALISHTNRIFSEIIEKSGRNLNQFCFGTAFINMNPNYKTLDNMDANSWKTEGYYDGLVVLSAIKKESLPNQFTVIPPGASIHDIRSRRGRQELDKRLDPEEYAVTLEGLLTAHYQYGGDMDMANLVVTSQKMAIILGEVEEIEKKRTRKYPAYAVYVAYRLENEIFRNDEMVGLGKFNKMKSKGPVGKSIKEAAALAAEANKAMADEAIRGISEGSIIAGDLGGLDTNYQLMWEAADKMDDEEEDRKTSIGGMSRDFSEDWERKNRMMRLRTKY
ncbi:unnamed protein product [Lepeophtheirus salmonis]|uniref:(salmon louse) hypothetical protein n=1 Tax=Lepeophtheirus salmonis TaxID=72036 RepID=A0A7R8CGJ5_LEPSM|nr:unnamed protein product [Lepeophtheirus salmonis]CAF2776694.1 unnamed protein product [Lepeophtheirus salmonis]